MAELDEFSADRERLKRQEEIARAMHRRGNLRSKANEMFGQIDQERAAFSTRYQESLASEVQRIAQMRQGRPEIQAPADELGGGPGAPAQAGDPRAAVMAAMVSRYAPVQRVGDLEYAHMKKSDEPYTLKPGEIRKTPGQPDVAAREKPSYENASPLAKLISEQEALPAGDPKRVSYDAAIRKATETARQISAHEAAKPPTGYRWKPDGSQEAIPGGPADTKLTGAFNQDTSSLQSSEAALDRLSQQVNLVEKSNLGRTTGMMGALPNIPGSEGSDAKGRLDALKYQIGFGVLQEMKANSKNASSGLGQVTEKEHVYLQSQLGNLEKAQSEDEIRRVLKDIRKFADESKGRLRAAYNLKHADKAAAPAAAPKGPRVVDW